MRPPAAEWKGPRYRRGRYKCGKCGKLGHNALNRRYHAQQELPSVGATAELKLSAVA